MPLEFRRCCRAGGIPPRYLHNTEGKGNPHILPSVSLHLALPLLENQSRLPGQLKTSGPSTSQIQVRDNAMGDKTQNKTTNKRLPPQDSASGFYLRCSIAVPKPTKAALQKPLSAGIKADPLCTTTAICAQDILSAALQGCPCCTSPSEYCREAGGEGGFSYGCLVAPKVVG